MARTLEAKQYPGLSDLLGGWFDQDYDLVGWTLAEIFPDYIASNDLEQRQLTVDDITRFTVKYGKTGEYLQEAVDRVFRPDMIIQGWEGLTTRQWLEQVKKMIQ